MRINSVITKMQASEKAYGCSLTFPSTAVVELIGQAGLDHISFDSKHGPFTPDDIACALIAFRAAEVIRIGS